MALAVTSELKAELSGILREFLVDIKYKFPTLKLDRGIEQEVKSHFKRKGFSDEFVSSIETQIKPSVGIAATTFQSTPFDIQCTVAIFTTYCLMIDDFAQDPEFRHHLKQFNTFCVAQYPLQNPVLRSMAEFLASFSSTFGRYSADMIIKDSLQFISGCCVEVENVNLQFPTEAREFPGYLRLKVGVAEAYSLMLFPLARFSESECLQFCLPAVPYLIRAFNGVNDIMSFYKEVVEQERCYYISNSATCEGLTQIEVLKKLCGEMSKVVWTLRRLGKAHVGLSEAIESFVCGYVVYHLVQTRYRMEDLGLEVVTQAREKTHGSMANRK